jgi:hypothetical protein
MAVCIVCMRWPDKNLPRRFIEGFPAVGTVEQTGVFATIDNFEEADMDNISKHRESVLSALPRKVMLHADKVKEAAEEDNKKKFGSRLMALDEVHDTFGNDWLPCPTFCVFQNGKHRLIDNGLAGHQNEHSSYVERLVLCNATQPGVAARFLYSAAIEENACLEGAKLESGGEDLPNAYRSCPVMPAHYRYNTRAVQCPQSGLWFFQIMYSLLFGFKNAVMSFNRLSFFLQALARRLLAICCSFYYDDASLVDWNRAMGSSQRLFGAVSRKIGFPFSDKKRQALSPSSDFLGLLHDLSFAISWNIITFRPRDALVEKVISLVRECLDRNYTSPAQASKILGCQTFCSLGIFG